jgi:FlaA1/EpsC-like NDP-sugar epimerase
MEGAHVQLIMMALGIIGAFCTIFGVWYKINADTNAKIDSISKAFSDQLANAIKENDSKLTRAVETGDQKRARIYERIDEVKTVHKEEIDSLRREAAENYVPVKICGLMHASSDKSISELKIIICEVDKKVDKLMIKIYEKNGGDKSGS